MDRRGESGQAVVEAAIILPAIVFLLLVALQLTQVQQARMIAEYAAFSAARAGIVMSGDNGSSGGKSDGPMHDAALLAVLPSYVPLGGGPGGQVCQKTFGKKNPMGLYMCLATAIKLEDKVRAAAGLEIVRVYVLNPVKGDFAKWGAHLNGKEIDFDDVRPGAADATQLSVQVRYLYEMRIPFANKLLQTIWLASHVGLLKSWQGVNWAAPQLFSNKGPDAVQLSRLAAAGASIPDGTPEGVPVAQIVAAGSLGKSNSHFYMPVEAFYTMRMQSNPYVNWAHP